MGRSYPRLTRLLSCGRAGNAECVVFSGESGGVLISRFFGGAQKSTCLNPGPDMMADFSKTKSNNALELDMRERKEMSDPKRLNSLELDM